MDNRTIRLSIAVLGATLLTSSPAQAQSHVAFAPAPASRTVTAVSPGGGVRTRFHFHPRRFFASSAYAPYFYSDDDSEPQTTDVALPQIIAVQTTPPASPAPRPNPPESVLLELRGDHWVRITDYGQSQTAELTSRPESDRAPDLASATPPATLRRTPATGPPSQLPPAMLVFRDGHKEEIGKYVIVGATIYASADYWSSGSWTRKVQIVELDVPATLKLNRERGAKFSLPSGPNEVMLRP